MQKQLNQITNFIKKNPMPMAIVGAVAVLSIGVIAYSQSHSSSLQRKQLESESKLASQIEDSKKKNQERTAKIAADKKAAEEKAAAEKAAAEKAAADQAAAEKAAAEKAAALKKPQYSAPAVNGGSISISVGTPNVYPEYGKAKIPVSWSAGFTSEKGFKIVWSTSPNPTYPNENYHYTGDNNSGGSTEFKVYQNGTYYVRACEYLGNGTCSSNYSNEAVVTVSGL